MKSDAYVKYTDPVDGAEQIVVDTHDLQCGGQAMIQKTWPYTTPEGYTYCYPNPLADKMKTLETYMADAAQGGLEGWDDAELPPEPTWAMVSDLLEEIRVLTRRASVLRRESLGF